MRIVEAEDIEERDEAAELGRERLEEEGLGWCMGGERERETESATTFFLW